MLVEKPRWKRGNIGYIDPAEPLMIRNGRQHYLIHWDNPRYEDEYVDCSYMHKMEDISKSKCTWYSPGEVWVSPKQCMALKGLQKSGALGRRLFEESSSPWYSAGEVRVSPKQCVALKGLQKSRALGRRLFEESSSLQQRIVEEDDTLELSIDPFAEVLPEERLQAAQKRSPKPPPQERLQAAQKRSPQVGEEDVQASKPLPEGRKKSPALQENLNNLVGGGS